MKIAVHQSRISGVDLTHMRHLYEALTSHELADVVDGIEDAEGYDFFIGGAPSTCTSIGHRPYDPHQMPLDYDPRPLWNRSYEKLYVPHELARLKQTLEEKWRRITWRESEVIDTVDYMGLHCSWPFREHLAPRLKHAKLMRIPISVPEWIFFHSTKPRDIDVFFLGAAGLPHPIRLRVLRALTKAADIKSRIEPHRHVGKWTDTQKFDDHQMWYADLLRRTKIAPFDGSIWDWPTNRYFEAMACGALVVAPMPHDGDILGFKEGVNMVVTNGHDVMDKIRYYLKHDDERKQIAKNGAVLCAQLHTSSARARDIYTKLGQLHDGIPIEHVEKQYDDTLATWSI